MPQAALHGGIGTLSFGGDAETVVIKHGGHHYGARAEFREHRDQGWHEGWRHRHADRVVVVKHGHHMD